MPVVEIRINELQFLKECLEDLTKKVTCEQRWSVSHGVLQTNPEAGVCLVCWGNKEVSVAGVE